MPKYFTYAPGKHGSRLKLGPNQRLGFVEDKGYYAIPKGGKSVQAQQMAAAAKAAAQAKRNAPLDVDAMIRTYLGANPMLTEGQRHKEAARQVAEALGAQEKAFERERAKQRQTYADQQLTQQGLAMAMAASRTADAPAIQAAWKQAGGDMASFAQAITGSVQAQQQGALAGSQGDVAQQVGSGNVQAPNPIVNADVSNYLGGTLPSQTAFANATTQYNAAVEKGDQQAMRFWDNQRAIAFEAQRNEGEMSADWRDIQSQRPKLLREAEEALSSRDKEKLATLMSVLNVKAGLAETQSQIDRRNAQTAIDKRKTKVAETAEERKEQERIDAKNAKAASRKIALISANASAANAATARAKALGVDVNGNPLPGFKIDPKTGRAIKDPAQANTTKWKDSVKVEQDFRIAATKWFRDNFIDKDLGRPMNRPPKKADLVKRIMGALGNSLVGKNGMKRETVQWWATQILNSFPKRWWNDEFYKAKPAAGGTATDTGDTTVIAP